MHFEVSVCMSSCHLLAILDSDHWPGSKQPYVPVFSDGWSPPAYWISGKQVVFLFNSSPTCSPLSPSVTHSLFHSRLKTRLLHKSFPPLSASTHLVCLLGLYWIGLILPNGFHFLVIFLSFLFWVGC